MQQVARSSSHRHKHTPIRAAEHQVPIVAQAGALNQNLQLTAQAARAKWQNGQLSSSPLFSLLFLDAYDTPPAAANGAR